MNLKYEKSISVFNLFRDEDANNVYPLCLESTLQHINEFLPYDSLPTWGVWRGTVETCHLVDYGNDRAVLVYQEWGDKNEREFRFKNEPVKQIKEKLPPAAVEYLEWLDKQAVVMGG